MNIKISYSAFSFGERQFPLSSLLRFLLENGIAEPQEFVYFAGEYYGVVTQFGVHYCNVLDIEIKKSSDAIEFTFESRVMRLACREEKDFLLLDKIIFAKRSQSQYEKDFQIKLYDAYYTNFEYKIFLLHFSNYVNNMKDQAKRTSLIELSKKPGAIYSVKDLTIRDKTLLIQLLETHNYLDSEILDYYRFDFDKQFLRDEENMTENLRRIIDNIAVEIRDHVASDNISFPNVVTICNGSSGYCAENNKMIIRNKQLFTELLRRDLRNPLKKQQILDMINMIIVDYFRFIKRASEVIKIYDFVEL